MHVRDVIRVLNSCAARGTDAYGLAVEVANAVEVDTREQLALVTDSLGMGAVSEAVRQGAHESIQAAIASMVEGLNQRYVEQTAKLQSRATLLQAVFDAKDEFSEFEAREAVFEFDRSNP